MTTPQEQYIESLRNSQEAVVQAMDAWTKSAQKAFGASDSRPFGTVDPNLVIDQVFDFAEQMLAMQRRFAKTLASSAAASAAQTSKGT